MDGDVLFSIEHTSGRLAPKEKHTCCDSRENLKGYKLSARDGEIGRAEEFYCDDQSH